MRTTSANIWKKALIFDEIITMKKYTILLVAAFSMMTAVDVQAQKAKGTPYGKAFKVQSVKTPEQLMETLSAKSPVNNVVVEGQIAQVCQAEGCWMKLKNAKGEDIMVKFKDHAFLIPKDLAGKTATVYGNASKKTISVAERKHMAEDAGATESEIAAINAPKDEVRIEATGIVVR